ncbi:hypothetical protein [Bythopirellula polymerisocia]|uniref:Uncharacterized protein n=1 Tax=Bythopirellula polymerisocia TaxID=2528003 RepID=A0A5C6CB39_9BACT|nr:hypothetical protein [Bythopirellula polymerisocia]TWU21305.1 hypothetical protein Pla144_47150 [Bythopirellula polymerisocia]
MWCYSTYFDAAIDEREWPCRSLSERVGDLPVGTWYGGDDDLPAGTWHSEDHHLSPGARCSVIQ